MRPIIDSNLTFKEAIAGTDAPVEILERLRLVGVTYISIDGLEHSGQLVVHEMLMDDVEFVFAELRRERFLIERVVPAVIYNWDDEASMMANNTSAFNWRPIPGSKQISLHGRGCALDINPLWNPYIKGNLVLPAGGTYDPDRPGTITKSSRIVGLFTSRKWEWGGDWETPLDYQHFEKSII